MNIMENFGGRLFCGLDSEKDQSFGEMLVDMVFALTAVFITNTFVKLYSFHLIVEKEMVEF